MELTRFLGTHAYTGLLELGRVGHCAWHIVRRELDGTRFLAQVWSPRPTDKELDQIRDTFLARFLDAEPLDPVVSHMGFDSERAWFLQALQGAPLSRLWAGWGETQREALMTHLKERLAHDPHPRCLHPETICFHPGLTQIPRVIGSAPWSLANLPDLLPEPTAGAEPAVSETTPWTHARNLAEPLSRRLRGRGQELPYLKSLMLGLSAPIPMERIVLLQGEEGVGKEHLAAWACAVAESEGIWVHALGSSAEEPPGRFLGRLVEAVLLGNEVDFYAERPEAAKALSMRVQAFAFLTGGRHLNRQESGPDPDEIKAALEALDFASLQHPRLIHLSALDRATPEVLGLVRELIHASQVPWLLSLTTGAQGIGLKPLIAQLRGEATASLVGVNRLEDEDLRQVLDDLLGPHELPVPFRNELITQSLGNPGLLRNLLELAQQAGALAWEEHHWVLVAGHASPPKAQDDLMRQIFLGRLQRLTPAAATLVRLLAVAEQSLPTDSLGRLLGLQGDALEDAIQGAIGSRLMLVQQGQARIPDPAWRDLVLGHTSPSELKRLARALVAVLQEQGVTCSLALRALASDEDTALANTLTSLDLAPPGPPASVARLISQALELKPTPLEAARLYEHLADAWSLGSAEAPASGPPPVQRALEALLQATGLLSRVAMPETDRLIEARLFRKQAQMLLRLRRPQEAHEALMAAAERLVDHPLHPEQPRLRLALGQLHLLQGHLTKGIRALEEGLQAHGGPKPLPQDQAPIMLVLGQAMGAQSQFQRAGSLLQSAQRMLEHGQDFRSLVPVQIALGQVRQAQGQTETCVALLQEALQTARMQGDLTLQAQGHLALGIVRSLQQFLGPALSHLDRSLVRAQRLGETPLLALIQIWRARTLAALGDPIAADHAQFQALALQHGLQTPEEVGDHLVLQGEVARFRSAWKDAARLYKAASDHFESTGLLWRQRLAQLRYAQAVAREALQSHREAPEQGWAILENLKGPVEGSGSRWLDLEWQRAHALLLSTVPATEPVVQETLHAWSEVQTAAREILFPAQVLEANTEGALLLLQQGERLGARARIQDAFPSFQQLWTRLPDSHESGFMGREDMHRFRQTVEAVGLRFILPERADPLLDWTPTQMNLPVFPDPG